MKSDVLNLVKEFKKSGDEKELKALIIVGSVPSVDEMIEEVKRWAK